MSNINYQIIRSARRTIAIQITPAGEILVRCPNRMKKADIDCFVQSKGHWIRSHLAKLPERQLPLTEAELAALAKRARAVIPARVAHFAPLVGVDFGRITIRCQHSRWGSCSGKGNLNFNCLLMLAPPEVLDYVAVHELCHRIELNHFARFWAEVERVMPDYRGHKAWLKEHGSALIGRLPTKT